MRKQNAAPHGQGCDTIFFSIFSLPTLIQNKGFQGVMPRFPFERGTHAAGVSHWSANAAESLPRKGSWPPTRTLRPIPSLFLPNNQSPVLSHFPLIFLEMAVSFLLEIIFFVSVFVSSLIHVPACHIALQIFRACFFKGISV